VIPPFVDAHHHLWDLDRHRHPWLQAADTNDPFLGPYGSICVNYRVPEFLADTDGISVVKTVHVQADFDPDDPVGETAWLMEQFADHGYPHGIVGAARLDAPDLDRVLAGHMAHANFRGIRQAVNWDDRPLLQMAERPGLLTDPAWRRGFGRIADLDLVFDLHLWPGQLLAAAELIGHYPNSRVVLDHTGLPIDQDPAGLAVWRTGMRALAAHDNVTTKISGLGMLDHNWTAESIRPIVLETIDIFGVDRCMFATNFPVDRLFGDYRTIVEAYSQITADFTDEERTALFAGTATAAYRI